MDFTKNDLDNIIKIYPGDFSVFIVNDGKLSSLYNSPDLYKRSGMQKNDFESIIKDNPYNIILENDRDKVIKAVKNFFQDSQVSDDLCLTYRIIHAEKYYTWINAKVRAIGQINSLPVIITVFRTIPENVDADWRVLDYTDETIYIVNKSNYELLYANKSALNIWGHGSYIGKKCYDYIHGCSLPCEWCEMKKMISGSTSRKELFVPNLNQWFQVSCYDIKWFGEDATVVMASDITKNIELRNNLQINMESLETIINNIPVGVGVCRIKDNKISTVTVNPRIKELFGISTENFSNNLVNKLDNIHPNDMEIVKSAMKKCYQPNIFFKYNFRFKFKGSDDYRYYHARVHTVSKIDTIFAFICISDVTSEKAVEDEKNKIRSMYETATEESHLVVWEYDIINRRIIMADNEFTKFDYSKFNLPKVIENVPDSLAKYIDDVDLPKFFKMYSDIQNGAKKAQCEVWYKFTPKTEPRCEKITYTTVFDENNKPVSAYGIGQNITAQKQREENYNYLNQKLTQSIVGSVLSSHLDLTNNKCLDIQAINSTILEHHYANSADEFLNMVGSDIVDENIKEHFQNKFNCISLIKLFKQGQNQFTLDFPIIFTNGEKKWVKSNLTMLQNPIDNCIEAITYAIDITQNKKNEDIISRMTNDDCDFIGLINPKLQLFTLQHGEWIFEGLKNYTNNTYFDYVSMLANNFLQPDEKNEFMEKVSLENVIYSLSQNSIFSVAYSFIEENNRVSKKQLIFRWLNAEKVTFLLLRLIQQRH